MVLEREVAEISVPPHPSVSSSATVGKHLLFPTGVVDRDADWFTLVFLLDMSWGAPNVSLPQRISLSMKIVLVDHLVNSSLPFLVWDVFADPRELISGVKVRSYSRYVWRFYNVLIILLIKGPSGGGSSTCFQSADLSIVECRPVCPAGYNDVPTI